jgi:pepF/M3 family oligoendopeptidase
MSETLPRWSVADIHESIDARSFVDATEALRASIDRAAAAFDEHGVRAIDPRPVTPEDGTAADAAIGSYNAAADAVRELYAYVYATVSTDSRDERAQALLSELDVADAALNPLLARLADWVHALFQGGGPDALGDVSETAADHVGPLLRLAERSDHQMTEGEERLYAELSPTGNRAWARLHRDLTSQLTAEVSWPDGSAEVMAMPAVRGLATHHDATVRRAALAAELTAWPSAGLACAAALNAIKGDANVVNRRRRWDSPLDASLFANAVGRATFDAMQAAVRGVLADFRRWMRTKAQVHGSGAAGGLDWADLMAPAPVTASPTTWDDGVATVRAAFDAFSPALGRLVDRALAERWIDAEPRDGKTGGAFCMPIVGDRSLVLLNWAGSADSTQTAAHELGHAYHNVTLAERTALQRRLPMALAETASIFCETLVVERGLERLDGADRLALLDVDLVGSNQVVVDIQSRFLFETELFARRQQRTVGVSDLCSMMTAAQAEAYGDGLDLASSHPYMWAVKPHYYMAHFYNWPYTYGLLFGLGLFARYRADPERFRAGYETLLSRAGMDTAEQLGEAFGLDVTSEAFWEASVDVLRDRIAEYDRLSVALGLRDG